MRSGRTLARATRSERHGLGPMGRARARVAGDDRGSAAVYAVLLPMTFILLFLVIQVALWFYGRTVATTAAQHGLDAARVEQGTDAAGDEVIDSFLDQLGGGIEGYDVIWDRTADRVSVQIIAEPVEILPGVVPADINVTLEAPIEQVD